MIPSPYGRQRPRTTRAHRASASATSRDLPTPASPTTVSSSQRDSRLRALPRLRDQRQLALAADEPRRVAPLRRVQHRDEPERGHRSAFPFSSSASTGSTVHRLATSACVASPISTSPGGAACSSRAATFTASPVARRSAGPVTTSPVLTPIRPHPEARQRVPHLDGRAHRPERIVLMADRDPNTAITASPMNFSTVPP